MEITFLLNFILKPPCTRQNFSWYSVFAKSSSYWVWRFLFIFAHRGIFPRKICLCYTQPLPDLSHHAKFRKKTIGSILRKLLDKQIYRTLLFTAANPKRRTEVLKYQSWKSEPYKINCYFLFTLYTFAVKSTNLQKTHCTINAMW